MSRELATEVRRLAGTRTFREAIDAAAREFVRRRQAEAERESAARAERQTRRLRKSARAIAAGGDPFYSGYNPREIRENMWRAHGVG